MTSHARSEDQLRLRHHRPDPAGRRHRWCCTTWAGGWTTSASSPTALGAIGDPMLDVILREEFERVKLVLHPPRWRICRSCGRPCRRPISRRSAVYEASLVQIEGRLPRRRPAPVQTRRIMAIVSRAPTLLAAYATPPPPPSDTLRDLRISVGGAITLEHSPTTCERLYVRFGKLEPIRVPCRRAGSSASNVPDDQYPIDLDHPALRPIPIDVQLQPRPTGGTTAARWLETEGAWQGGSGSRAAPLVVDRAQRSNTALLQLDPQRDPGEPDLRHGRRDRSGDGHAPVVGDSAQRTRLRRRRSADPPVPARRSLGRTDAHTCRSSGQRRVSAVLAPRPTPYSLAAQVNGVRSRETAFDFSSTRERAAARVRDSLSRRWKASSGSTPTRRSCAWGWPGSPVVWPGEGAKRNVRRLPVRARPHARYRLGCRDRPDPAASSACRRSRKTFC